MTEVDPEWVEAVSAAAGSDVTDDQVVAVLSALGILESGDDLGTVKRHPDGDLAYRVLRNGRPVWWVIPSNGDKPYRNAEPTLSSPWETM